MKNPYRRTMYACFAGYIVQAIVNNFVPLLFITFQKSYGISLAKITFLITFNFGIQLLVDLLSAGFIDRIGYRASILTAHVCSGAGLLCLAVLPGLLPDPFLGLLISVTIYAVGGGLIEVLVSPIMEACPFDNKKGIMSLLHSFYCWGHVGVVLISTLFFACFGTESWQILAVFWAIIPLANTFIFAGAPIASLKEEAGEDMPVRILLSMKTFWVMILLMLCAGACEQAVSQWASAFAEKGLGISKTAGDLAGPMTFALLMGSSRALYSRLSQKLDLLTALMGSGLLCLFSYLLITLAPWAPVQLLGCALCGFSVGILWPGTFSLASERLRGGTAMFALFALAGDLGCSLGPTLVGSVSGMAGDELQAGILAAVCFPVLLLLGLLQLHTTKRKPVLAG